MNPQDQNPNLSSKKQYLNKTKLKFYQELKKIQKDFKPTKETQGFGGYAIIGEKNYPNLQTYNISNEEKLSSYKNTAQNVKQNYDNIIKQKAKNIFGTTREQHIKQTTSKINEELQNIYKSKKEVEFTTHYSKELQFNKISMNSTHGIMGSNNQVNKINANQNTSTSKQIEKFADNEEKAKNAIISLYEREVNEHQIINLLALGTFGLQSNKKLVPTRWAITAYDQTLEKHLHQKIIKYNPLNSYEIYHHKDKGNEFIIILFPEPFQAQVTEKFEGGLEEDYVSHNNKLQTKEPMCSGGYYATKLPVFEQLNQRKKQSAYISIRIIKDYELPLGVVFVRESVRTALKNQIFKTSNKQEMLKFLFENYKNHFELYLKSKFKKEIEQTKTLNKYFT